MRALPLSDLPNGSTVGVEVGGKKLLLSNLDGEIHAVSGICTHEYYELAQGFMIEGAVTCALHLSQFDLRTGAVYNPPATEPLQVFNIKIEDGAIFVEV